MIHSEIAGHSDQAPVTDTLINIPSLEKIQFMDQN